MSSIAHDASPLVLHVDPDGQVWSVRSRQSPRRTRLDVFEFLNYAHLSGRIHVVGTRENSGLLAGLWEARARIPEMQLYVGTPRLVENAARTSDALSSVVNSQPLSPSVGGWHQFTEHDATAYALAYRLSQSDLSDAHALALVKHHPVWPLASFIKTLNPVSLAHWIAEVRDPRWYVQAKDPNSTAPLERYLGLWPNMQAALINDNPRAYAAPTGRRCHITRTCWLPETDLELEQLELDEPRNFLVRVVASRCPDRPIVGMVRASQLFTRFIRAIWLCQISGYALFDPREFLRDDELESFTSFAALATR